MVGQRIGDINVFGAGLVFYSGGVRVGRPRGQRRHLLHRSYGRVANAQQSPLLSIGRSGIPVREKFCASRQYHFDIKPNPNGGTGFSERIRTRDLPQQSAHDGDAGGQFDGRILPPHS
jgi:hypothetical protein